MSPFTEASIHCRSIFRISCSTVSFLLAAATTSRAERIAMTDVKGRILFIVFLKCWSATVVAYVAVKSIHEPPSIFSVQASLVSLVHQVIPSQHFAQRINLRPAEAVVQAPPPTFGES